MSKRFLMQKAHKLKTEPIGGWYASEKLDGMRVFWDGGISRGVPKADVPYANHWKDERYKIPPIATGLWTQLGNVVHAPEWFLDGLPRCTMLGGELWKGYGYRQDLMSAVKKLIPIDSEWEGIKIHCYELPIPKIIFADAKISTPTCKINFTYTEVVEFAGHCDNNSWNTEMPFCYIQKLISQMEYKFVVPHPQKRLPLQGRMAREHLDSMLTTVMTKGGEGIVLRNPDSVWEPHRTHNLLKVKPTDDAEGIVTGYVTGAKTDKGSKLLGMMGALVLDYNGQRLELSGFTNAERQLIKVGEGIEDVPEFIYIPQEDCPNCRSWDPRNFDKVKNPAYTPIHSMAKEWATNNPKTDVPDWIEARFFPIGTVVSFKHRGFTKSGLPEEARYWRKRLDD